MCYDYHVLDNAERWADTAVGEKPDEISIQAMNREYERQHPEPKQDAQE